MPKEEGMRVMISTLQSRVFGFGLTLTKEQMMRVMHKMNASGIMR